MIEQITLKEFLYPGLIAQQLKYTEDGIAKMEKTTNETDLLISDDDYFRYITVTEDNQIVTCVLDINSELKHRIISPDDIK